MTRGLGTSPPDPPVRRLITEAGTLRLPGRPVVGEPGVMVALAVS